MNEEKKEATFFGKKEEDKPQKKGRGRPPKADNAEAGIKGLVCLSNFIHNGVSKKQGDDLNRLSSQDVKHLQAHGLVGTEKQLEELRLAKKFGIRKSKVFPIDVNLD